MVKQNSCSQPTVEKALERVRQAILDPSADFLLVRPMPCHAMPCLCELGSVGGGGVGRVTAGQRALELETHHPNLLLLPVFPSPSWPLPLPQRVDGHVVGEDRMHVQLRNLASEFGEPLVDLVLAKKKEMEKHCPSG